VWVIVAPFTGAWIETYQFTKSLQYGIVAPFTGAWIETVVYALFIPFPVGVAPFTGAWIETYKPDWRVRYTERRALYGRVD